MKILNVITKAWDAFYNLSMPIFLLLVLSILLYRKIFHDQNPDTFDLAVLMIILSSKPKTP